MKKKPEEVNFGLINCLFSALGYQVTDIKTKGTMATVYYRDSSGKKLKKPKKKVAKK